MINLFRGKLSPAVITHLITSCDNLKLDFTNEGCRQPSKNLKGHPCPQSSASGPAYRPLSGDKGYRACTRPPRFAGPPAGSLFENSLTAGQPINPSNWSAGVFLPLA